MEIDFEELAHKVMAADKSHNLLSASWRPKRVIGVIQLDYGGLDRKSVV